MRRILIPVILSALLPVVGGCTRADSNGLIVTHDGRMVSETADVSREELSWQLGHQIADHLGTGWLVKAVIDELPTLHAARADEYGWTRMTVHLTLIPPVGSHDSAAATAAADKRARELVNLRIRSLSGLTLDTTCLKAGTPAPGSQTYTTVAGDTWVGISTAFYGSAQHWRVIADANPGVDGAHMPAGTALIIPAKP